MTRGTQSPIVEIVDTGIDLRPDPSRTITRFFVPGHEDVGAGDSRAGLVIERILKLDDEEVADALQQIEQRFASRWPQIAHVFDEHAALVTHRLDTSMVLTTARRRLLGAAFTHEYSIEGAAVCNPSIVRHPTQPTNGDTAFVLSVRGIGEGHRSSIGFRTGVVTPTGSITLDPTSPHAQTGLAASGSHTADAATRGHTASTIAGLEQLAHCSYRVEFAGSSELSDRVLWPRSPAERHGMEDARFVEITDNSAPRYCATYTAFDGTTTSQHLLTTDDFANFAVTPMAGAAARGKGLALFPRRVNGLHVAVSRADRETNSIAYSNDLRCWDTASTIQTPQRAWEILQLGNCGSPIETPAGWLVLTHGVGPMRTYAIGALLLDLDEPHRVIGSTDTPLLTPNKHDGYVPNVVYTCGAIALDERLILPYAIGDQTISIATLNVNDLITTMRKEGHTPCSD